MTTKETQMVYTFDLETREYIASYERDTGAMTSLGEDRTLDAPNELQEGYINVRNAENSAWQMVADHRKKKQYSIFDGSESEVDYLGDIKAGYTLEARPATYYDYNERFSRWEINDKKLQDFIATAKSTKIAELTSARDARIDAFDLITIGKGSFNIDRVGLNYLSNRLTAQQGAQDQDIIAQFIASDNKTMIELTKSDIIEILNIQNEIESRIGLYYIDLVNQVGEAQTIEAIDAIKWQDQIRHVVKAPTFDEKKALKLQEINKKRNEVELSSFEFMGGVYDADIDASRRINNAALAARSSIDEGLTLKVDWILKNNTTKSLNERDLLALQAALTQHVATTFGIAQMLKEKVVVAKTARELEAIKWPDQVTR